MSAARAWNSLPLEARACSSFLTFRMETADVAPSTPMVCIELCNILDLDFCKVPPQLCDGNTLIHHDFCTSSSSSSSSIVQVAFCAILLSRKRIEPVLQLASRGAHGATCGPAQIGDHTTCGVRTKCHVKKALY